MAEALLWDRLRNRKLHGFKFRRQDAIGRFIVDLYRREARLVIEVDGSIHRGQVVEDAEREAELQRLGLNVVRFTNEEVTDQMTSAFERIAAHLAPDPSPRSEGEVCD